MAINKKIIFVWLVFFVIVSINVNGFDITIDTIIDGSMINTNSTWLNITTDKYAVCQYKLNSDPYLGFSSTDVGYWKAGSSYNKLEISEKLNPPETNIEQIINITEFIGKNELNGLADRSITNDKGTFDYNQSLYFDNSHQTGYVIYTEDDNDVTSDFLYFKSGEQIARYNLEFNTPFESDVEDSNGNTDTTGLYLGDYKNKKIKILGKEYEIVKARRVTATGNDIDLTL
ncbi:hypothetical protein J4209_06515, partial [Candidatus Woesearchaeota archaeon]|nr:hypothetical protein [Candidatus Woesearchaeota archaeon]